MIVLQLGQYYIVLLYSYLFTISIVVTLFAQYKIGVSITVIVI